MLHILEAYGIPLNLLRAIDKMYTNTMAESLLQMVRLICLKS